MERVEVPDEATLAQLWNAVSAALGVPQGQMALSKDPKLVPPPRRPPPLPPCARALTAPYGLCRDCSCFASLHMYPKELSRPRLDCRASRPPQLTGGERVHPAPFGGVWQLPSCR